MIPLTALAAVRQDLDWSGFAVVMAMLAVILLALIPGTRQLFRRNDDWLKDFAQEGLDTYADVVPGVDHETCVNDDCDLVLCYCRDQDGPCEGTVEPGCMHVGEFVCDEHRLAECQGCREDARWDSAVWPR